MIRYTLILFLSYSAWSVSGFVLHVLKKLARASVTHKDDFRFRTFMNLNLIGYLYSLGVILVFMGLFAYSPSQLKELPPVALVVPIINFTISLPWQFWLVVIGFSGGSALKKLLNRKLNSQ